MSSGTTAVSEGEILSRAIDTIDRANWNQVAHVISQLRLPERDLDRADFLLERNRTGAITESEQAELDVYLRVGTFLDLMRARALRNSDWPPPQ